MFGCISVILSLIWETKPNFNGKSFWFECEMNQTAFDVEKLSPKNEKYKIHTLNASEKGSSVKLNILPICCFQFWNFFLFAHIYSCSNREMMNKKTKKKKKKKHSVCDVISIYIPKIGCKHANMATVLRNSHQFGSAFQRVAFTLQKHSHTHIYWTRKWVWASEHSFSSLVFSLILSFFYIM